MLQISEIVKKTEEMFDLFNRHFYSEELTRPAITVFPDGGRGVYGWCSIHEIWNTNEEKDREINLCAEYLDLTMVEPAATLLHEMCYPQLVGTIKLFGGRRHVKKYIWSC